MNKIPILWILGLLILVVGVSGCTSNAGSFNQSRMSFDYPADNYTLVNVNNSSSDDIMEVELNGSSSDDVNSQITVQKFSNSTNALLQYGVLTGGVISRNTTTIDGIYTHLESNLWSGDRFQESEWYFEKNGYYYLITNYFGNDPNATEMIIRTLN